MLRLGMGFALLCFLPAMAQAFEQRALHAVGGASFTLASAQTVQLSGIATPDADKAKAALERLVAGREVYVTRVTQNPDRYGRILAHAYLQNDTMIEGELLKQGLAMVNDFTYQRGGALTEMLADEREARRAKRGIWAEECCRVIAPAEAGDSLNRFRIVEGKVVSTTSFHGHFYIHFSSHWKGDFTVFISGKTLAREHTREDFAVLMAALAPGRMISVRGWIRDHRGSPDIDVISPQQVELE